MALKPFSHPKPPVFDKERDRHWYNYFINWTRDLRSSITADITAVTHDPVTVSDSSEIDFTLTGQDITASIVASSIDETKLDASTNASLDLADSSLQSSDIGVTVQAHSAVLDATTASFTTADETKLDGIEALADVTDTANVTAAGALMDSEVDADLKTFALPANTTISAFGATLVDDATAAAARTTLDVDQAGTDNSTDVTLNADDATQETLSLVGQELQVNLATGSTDGAMSTGDKVKLTFITVTQNVNLDAVENTANSALQDVVDDTTPQLGGALDLNSNDITGTGNINITGNVSLTGTVDGRDVAADGTNIDLNTTHRSSNGTDHSYIDQDVTQSASPTFAGQTITPASDEADLLHFNTDRAWKFKTTGSDANAVLELQNQTDAKNWEWKSQDDTLLFRFNSQNDRSGHFDFRQAIQVDTINETTAAAGVTIDGLLLKDGELIADAVRNKAKIGSSGSTYGTTLPTYALWCDGAAVSRTTYADLFAEVGTTYGVGDGSTTFNLPDDNSQNYFSRAASTAGGTGGSAAHTHSVDPPNTTSTSAGSHNHTVDPPNTTSTSAGSHSHGGSTGTQGGGTTQGGIFDNRTSGHNHSISSDGSHTHDTNIASFNSGTESAHTHDTNIGSFTSGSTNNEPPYRNKKYYIWY